MTLDDVMRIGHGTAPDAERTFREAVDRMEFPRVLELGTLRWEAALPTHHSHWVPHASEFVMSDVEAGTDVDVVADAHTMSAEINGQFNAIIAVSVWEHLQRPWIAARELASLLKKGGHAFVCTHQTFPLHGYPHDYFRFSREALMTIFEDPGLVTVSAGYQYPVRIIPPAEVTRWNEGAEAYLNVAWHGYKP